MWCQSAFCLADCIKEKKAEESKVARLYFCRRAGLCESKIFLEASFNIRCAQSPFYLGKPPSEQARK